MDFHDRYTWAEILFGDRRYTLAAKELESLLADVAAEQTPVRGLGEARQLLARAHFHAAHLVRAEETAREILADNPVDAYAALLLYRSLERQSRHEEAAQARTLAAVLGAPGMSWEDDEVTSDASDRATD